MPVLPPKGPFIPLGGMGILMELGHLHPGRDSIQVWGKCQVWAEVGIAQLGQSQATMNECVAQSWVSSGRLQPVIVVALKFFVPGKEICAALSCLMRFLGKDQNHQTGNVPRPLSSSPASPSSNLAPLSPAVCPYANGKTSLSLSLHLKIGNRSICLPGLDEGVW